MTDKQQVTTRENRAGGDAALSSSTAQRTIRPPVDIVETDHGITLIADLPGVSKDRLGVKVDGDQLVVEGSALIPWPESFEVLHSEVHQPFYRRAFTLSRELDPTKIEASLRDGVLRLHIPKAEDAKPRRIEVRVG